MFGKKKINWLFVGLLSISLLPVLPFFFIGVSVFIFLVFSIINCYSKHHKKESHSSFNLLLIQISFFLILFGTSIYFDGLIPSTNYLQSSFSLLLFPIIWLVDKKSFITNKERNVILQTFTIASFILGVYLLLFSLYFSINNKTEFQFLFAEVPFLGIHPNYVSVFFLMAIIYLLFEYKTSNLTKHYCKLFMSVFFGILIFSYAARSAIIILVVILFIELILKKKQTILRKTITFMLLIIISISSIIFIKPLHKKVKELSSREYYELPYKKYPTSFQIRLGLYDCSLPIIKENWTFGKGVVSFENATNQCYSKFNNVEEIKYNSHNYYLFLLGSGGVFCLLSFFCMLFWHLTRSIKYQDYTYLYFILVISITMLTEDFLSRIYGVVFTMFFLTIFIKNKRKHIEE